MLFNIQEGVLELNGNRVDYAAFGDGARPMLLIQGLTLRPLKGGALPVAHMYRLFAKDYRVYLFDRPEVLPEPCSVEALAESVNAAMEALGLSGADVLGVSQGGMIAQYLALNHPDKVRRLALAVTLSRTNPTMEAVIARWTAWISAGDTTAMLRDMLKNMYSEAYARRWGWVFPVAARVQKLLPPDRFCALARSCLTCESYDRLGELRCPALVLGGEEDRIVTPDASREIAERLGCPIHMYPELGHAAYEEAGDFNRRVYDFFRQGDA